MKRALLCALLTLLAVSSAASPAEAERVRVRMHQARAVDADTARLTGVVTGREVVHIQRYAAARGRWVSVRRIRTDARGTFRTTVPAVTRARYFRAVAGGRASKVRVVVAPPAGPIVPEPETPMAPDPDPPVVPRPDVPVEPDPPTDPSDACGPRPLKADGTRWSCTLADDFDGTTLDRSLWTPQTIFQAGSPTGMPCYVDDPSVISVRDGALHLSVREVPQPLVCPGLQGTRPTAHVAGMVSTYYQFSQQYGRFEARFRTTATREPGLQEAFWLWPDVRDPSSVTWPAAGEIDIVETYSEYADLAIPFLHYTSNDNGGPRPGLNTAWDCTVERGEFNTYTLEWSAGRLAILVNGKTCLVNTSGDPAFQKRYIVALTQALGTTTNAYDGRAPLPATMTVDYVRVWQ